MSMRYVITSFFSILLSWMPSLVNANNAGDVLFNPDNLGIESYLELSHESFGGGNLSGDNLEKLEVHATQLLTKLSDKIINEPDFKGQDLNNYEWFLALLEAASDNYSKDKPENSDVFYLKVVQPINLKSIILDFNNLQPVLSSEAGKILQLEKTKGWIDFLQNMPDAALSEALSTLSEMPLLDFKKSALAQAALRYALNLVLVRERNFNYATGIHTPQNDSLTIYESAILRLSESIKTIIRLGDGWDNSSLRSLRQNQLQLANLKSLERSLPDSASGFINGGHSLVKLYDEYQQYISDYPDDESVLDDWLKTTSHYQVNVEKVNKETANLRSHYVLLNHSINYKKNSLPSLLLAEYAQEFIQLLDKGVVGGWQLDHNGEKVEINEYTKVVSKEIIRPHLKYDRKAPYSQLYMKSLISLLDYFYSVPERLEVLRGDKAFYSELLLSVFAGVAEEEWSISLAKLRTFSLQSLPKERQLLYAHLRWQPVYWIPENWGKNGLLAQSLGFYDEQEFSYHAQQVETVGFLSKALSLPLDVESENTLAGSSNTPSSEAGRVYQSIQKLIKDGASADNGLGQIYNSLFHTTFKGKYVVSKSEYENNVIGTTENNDEKEALKVIFPAGELSENLLITLDNLKELNLFKLTEVTGKSLVESAHDYLSKNYDLIQDDSTVSALQTQTPQRYQGSLARFLYAKPKYPEMLNELEGELAVEWNDQWGGQALYETSIRSLITMALAQSEKQTATSAYYSAGFIFEPEVRTGEWLTDTKRLQKLITARQHYVNANALYRSLIDRKKLREDPRRKGQSYFGEETLLRWEVANPVVEESSTIAPAEPFSGVTITRPIPSEVIPYSNGKDRKPSLLAIGLVRGLEQTRNQIDRLDLGQDAFGYTGTVKMAAGIEELFQKLEFFADAIEQSDITATVTALENSLTLQRQRFAKDSKHQLVYAKAFELGAIDLKLVNADLRLERTKLESSAKEADLFAAHFDTEAARQFAESAHATAAAALLEANEAKYAAFVINAQIEMLVTILPAYTFQLEKAEGLLKRTANLIREYENLLKSKRASYLSRKSKRDVGSMIKAIAVQVADAVSVAYGLPPLGSIVDRTFKGIEAANDGNWAAAIDNLREAASLSGADKEIEKATQKVLGDVFSSKEMKWALDVRDTLEKSKFLTEIKKTADESGLSDYAAAEGLAFLNNVGKGVLPDEMIDRIIDPEDFQWVNNGNIKKNVQDMLAAATAKHGQALVGQLAKSGLKESLKLISDDKKLEIFVRTRLNVDLTDDKEPGLEGKLLKAAGDIRKDVSGSLRKLIDQQIKTEEQKFSILKAQTENYLKSVLKAQSVEVTDQAFIKLIAGLRSKKMSKNGKDEWKEFIDKDLNEFIKTHKFDEKVGKAIQSVFDKTIKAKSLDDLRDAGIIQTGEAFLEGLGDSLISGQFDLETNRNQRVISKAEGEKRIRELEAFSKSMRTTLVGIKSALDLSVGVQTAQFVPDTQGQLVKVLDSWDSELTALFEKTGDVALSADIKGYYEMVEERFKRVDLYQELSAKQMETLMNPPEVSLPTHIQEKIRRVDASLSEARQTVEAITASQKQIYEQINKIYNVEKDFNTQFSTLFSPFKDKIDKLVNKVRDAREQTGWASRALSKWLNNDPALKTLTDLTFELYNLRGKIALDKAEVAERKKQKAILERSPLFKNKIQRLDEEISQANGKVKEKQQRIDDLKDKLIDEAFKKAANAYVDQIVKESSDSEYALQEGHNSLLLSTFDSKLFSRPPVDAEKTQHLTRGILQVNGYESASGLYQLAQKKKEENWVNEVKSLRAQAIQRSKSHQALGKALTSSANRARQQAEKRRVAVSKLNIQMAEGARTILQVAREAIVSELQAAEYDFLASDTEHNLSQLNSWELNATGEKLRILSPGRVELVSREVSRVFRDIAFISHYYESIDIRKSFNETANSDAEFDLFNQQGIWKPQAITNMVKSIGIAREIPDKRMSQDSIVTNGPDMLTITKNDLLRYGSLKGSTRLSPDVLLSLYLQVEPRDSLKGRNEDDVYVNPEPFWLRNDKVLGANMIRPGPKTMKVRIPESVTGSRTRYVSIYRLKPKDGDRHSEPDHMYIRHMGDGYITIAGTERNKKIIPIHWQPLPPRIGPGDWETREDSKDSNKTYRLRVVNSAGGISEVKETEADNKINFDYFAKITGSGDALGLDWQNTLNNLSNTITDTLNRKLENRSAFHLYPLAGTYELLINLPDGFAALPEDFKVKLLFVGSTLGAQAGNQP